jgi:hypothetical protein
MRALLFLPLIALSVVALPAAARNPELSCSNAQFDARVLERFPKVREACLDVIDHDGHPYAVFKADLLRVTAKGVQIRPALPGGSRAEARFVQVHPDRRVLIEGKPYRFDELALGQELTVYIRVTEPLVAVAPADTGDASWDLAPLEVIEQPAQVVAAEMPHTAGAVPYVGAVGGLLMSAGALLSLIRRRRSRQCEKSIAAP